MNKTQKDFERAITVVEKDYIGYQLSFNWKYVKEEDFTSTNYKIVYFTNQMVSTVIKFNPQHGILDIANIGNEMIKKLKEMQQNLEGS